MPKNKGAHKSSVTTAAQKVANVARSLTSSSKPAGSAFSRKGGGPGSKSSKK
jgi:hypothetical protein